MTRSFGLELDRNAAISSLRFYLIGGALGVFGGGWLAGTASAKATAAGTRACR